MKISQRIAAYKEQVEAEFGLELATIQTQKINNLEPIEKFKAFCELEQEIITTINEQTLTQWLIDNEIPEDSWEDYTYYNDTLYYRGEVVEDE